ncbi:hypothetical protein [Azospirillum isscasi]|uniref:Uncharacterized protein n=1 Tax=Azospirillum isscasi TaxID=3053926 RepID=A0ABU0WKG5_9PROT|nr:hypothetical protein [Azospirillum isscasi]MDQ2103434.1 hypothetical protein [Azospirillum isscasi]
MNTPSIYDNSVLLFVRTTIDRTQRAAFKERLSNVTRPDTIIIHDLNDGISSEFLHRVVIPYLCASERHKELIVVEAASSQTAAKVKAILNPEDGLGVIKPLHGSTRTQAMGLFCRLEERCAKIVQRKIDQENAWWKKSQALVYLKIADTQVPEYSSLLAPVIRKLEHDEVESVSLQSQIQESCLELTGQFAELVDILSEAKIMTSSYAPHFLRTWCEAIATFAMTSLPRLHGVEVASLLRQEFENRTPDLGS